MLAGVWGSLRDAAADGAGGEARPASVAGAGALLKRGARGWPVKAAATGRAGPCGAAPDARLSMDTSR